MPYLTSNSTIAKWKNVVMLLRGKKILRQPSISVEASHLCADRRILEKRSLRIDRASLINTIGLTDMQQEFGVGWEASNLYQQTRY